VLTFSSTSAAIRNFHSQSRQIIFYDSHIFLIIQAFISFFMYLIEIADDDNLTKTYGLNPDLNRIHGISKVQIMFDLPIYSLSIRHQRKDRQREEFEFEST